MSKPISNYFELKDVCRSAGLWYVGSFMIEFLKCREMWENPATKSQFVRYMHEEYSLDRDMAGTRTRVNAIIRIVESRYVEDALNLVLEANDKKLGCLESKVNAQWLLDQLSDGSLSY